MRQKGGMLHRQFIMQFMMVSTAMNDASIHHKRKFPNTRAEFKDLITDGELYVEIQN